MNRIARDGSVDVAILAATRVDCWPSVSTRLFSHLCSEFGLSVGVYGGSDIMVKGVIPSQIFGADVILEDSQHRIHKIQAKAIVKVCSEFEWPDPFEGWYSAGLLPFESALKLLRESLVSWWPVTAILGTGNKAFRLGSMLLESGKSKQVICIESEADWGGKRFSGWEVEKRHFEMLGGKIVEGKTLSLKKKNALVWEFRVRDERGVRVFDVARVIAAGPFRKKNRVREFPPGSFLFEWTQLSLGSMQIEESSSLDEAEAYLLSTKIIKALAKDLSGNKGYLDHVARKAKGALRYARLHQEEPFTPFFLGKWMDEKSMNELRSFSGVPQLEITSNLKASIECVEKIGCEVCARVCPEDAIVIQKQRVEDSRLLLKEETCTACGICVQACPSGAIAMIQENSTSSYSTVVISWSGKYKWRPKESVSLLNRKGEILATGRVRSIQEGAGSRLVFIDVPIHLIWEVRAIRPVKNMTGMSDFQNEESFHVLNRVEILLNGEKRLVRDGLSLSVALLEIGLGRAEDILLCSDGSCGLCQAEVDGIKKAACQTRIHRGMSVVYSEGKKETSDLCPCLELTRESVEERIRLSKLQSPDLAAQISHVGEGKCHGQFCASSLKTVLRELGVQSDEWVDWRFPWMDWKLSR